MVPDSGPKSETRKADMNGEAASLKHKSWQRSFPKIKFWPENFRMNQINSSAFVKAWGSRFQIWTFRLLLAADKEHTMAMKTRDSTNTVVGPTFGTQGWVFSMELFKDGEVWSDLRAPSSPACHHCRISRCRLHRRLPRQSPSTWTTPLQHHRTSRNRIKVISIENQWI